MIQETQRRMRSSQITSYYTSIVVADVQADTVTGTLYAVTDWGNEIIIYETNEPVSRQSFVDQAGALETALNEPWFTIEAYTINNEA